MLYLSVVLPQCLIDRIRSKLHRLDRNVLIGCVNSLGKTFYRPATYYIVSIR